MIWLDPRALLAVARGKARRGRIHGVPVHSTRLRAVLGAIPKGCRWTAAVDDADPTMSRLVISWGGPRHRGSLRLHSVLPRVSEGIADLRETARTTQDTIQRCPGMSWIRVCLREDLRTAARAVGLCGSRATAEEVLTAIRAHCTRGCDESLL